MPAARYWRIVGVETYAGGDLELSELHLYDASGRVDAAATLTSTIAPTAGTLAALQDDNLGTACRFAGAAVSAGGFALVWDFGAGNTAEAIEVRLGAATEQATFMAGCTLQNSPDGAEWTWSDAFARYEWPGAGAYTAPPKVGDPHWNKVVSLLHFDGDLTDETGRIWDQLGAPIIGGDGRFGGCITFSGSPSERVTSTHQAFGTDDWTVEMWVKFNSTSGQQNFFENLNSAGINPEGRFTIYQFNSSIRVFINSSERINTPIPSTDTWHHLSVSCESGRVRLFVDGAIKGSWNSGGLNFDQTLTLFGAGFGTDSLYGSLDELRITKGVARYTADFMPPTAPFLGAGGSDGTVFVSPNLHTADSAAQIAASAPVPAFSTRRAPALTLARDVEHGGPGTIYGTTKTKGTPNLPTKARVVLLHQRSKLPVREVWSDPITGAFVFEGIDTTQQFLTLAEDAAGNFRPVAASRLVPEVAP